MQHAWNDKHSYLLLLRRTLVLVLRVLSLEWISLRMEPISNSNIIHIASLSFTSPFLFFFLSLTCLFTFSSFLGLWSVFLVYSNFLLFLLCFLNYINFRFLEMYKGMYWNLNLVLLSSSIFNIFFFLHLFVVYEIFVNIFVICFKLSWKTFVFL